jgi:chlorobactene glucosyltransferase
LLEILVTLGLLPTGRAMLWRLPRVPLREAPARAPCVSVVVPARNEERVIERCVRSLLAQRYPDFEVIVLDDRSTDGTPAILAGLAAADQRLRVLQGEPLQVGWIGKCWACHQAAKAARGAWLLFVDADTRHHPLMLASAMAYASERQADLLSLAPHQELATFGERALLPAIFGIILTAGGSPAEVNDPGRSVAKAVGQFMLFRTQSYRRIGGHESVKNEMAEDFALARRTKGTGHRLLLGDGADLVSTRMYHSLGEIWQGFSKNAYFEARRQPGGAVWSIALPWLVIWLPPLVLPRLLLKWRRSGSLNGPERATLLASGLHAAIVTAFCIQVTRLVRLSLGWALTVPAGLLFFGLIVANSTRRVLTGRGVIWKGRRY